MSDESSKTSSSEKSAASESVEASRIASRMAKETIESEISKEIVEQAVEEGLASASGAVIFFGVISHLELSSKLTVYSFKGTIKSFKARRRRVCIAGKKFKLLELIFWKLF